MSYGWYSYETAPDTDFCNGFKGCDTIKAGFIGAGKVGLSMARYFKYKSIDVSGFYIGSHSDNTKAEFIVFDDLQYFIDKSDIIFLTVTDRAISQIWSRLEKMNIQNKIICHCSGSLSSEIFINADKLKAFCCSLHPILPFETDNVSLSQISKAYFTIEGNKTAVENISSLLDICKNPYYIIDSKNKAKYHCAACFASNFVVAVCQKAAELMSQCGFEYSEAIGALTPLILSNVNNICQKGALSALTGPVERNDTATVKLHMEVLNSEDRALYKELSRILVDIGAKKHGDRDYTKMEELLL